MKKPLNILFVNLPSNPIAQVEKCFSEKNAIPTTVVLPLGILYLSSYLQKHKLDTSHHIIDYAAEIYLHATEFSGVDELILSAAGRLKIVPDLICISVMFSCSHPFMVRAVQLLKANWPEAKVIVGGNHATNSTDILLQHEEVDFVTRGEGEIAIVEIVRNFKTLGSTPVQGVYSRADLDAGMSLSIAQPVQELDEIPFPDWDLLNMEIYVSPLIGRGRHLEENKRRELSIMTTRGCPFSCTFCASHTVAGRSMRFRSVENVMAEIDLLHEKYGVNLFIPEDDLFTANRKKVIPLLKEMAKRRETIPGFELQFPNALSVNTLFDDVMDAMIEAGMKVTNVAIESGSDFIQRKVIFKNVNLDRAKHVVKYFRERDVIVRTFFIGGFPGETKEHMQETIQFARDCGTDWGTFSIAAPLRGTVMYQQFVDGGYIKDDIATWSSAFFQERAFDTPEIGAEELKDLWYRANLDVNFINNINFREGNYEKAISIFNDIIHGYPFHVIGWYCIMRCYEKLGREADAIATRKKIYALIEDDERSKDMFHKFGDFMEGIQPGEAPGSGLRRPNEKDGAWASTGMSGAEVRQRKNVAHPEPSIPDLAPSNTKH